MDSETVARNFEGTLGQQMFSRASEKTFIEKLFAKEDAERIRTLMKKDPLAREDMLELLNLLSGVEAKLVNLSEWDRYVTLKYFVWVRELLKINMFLFDYEESLKKSGKTQSKRAQMLMENNKRMMEHNNKFLIDLYLNLNRTTLSLSATGFLEVLKNKFELLGGQSSSNLPVADPKSGGFLSGLFKK